MEHIGKRGGDGLAALPVPIKALSVCHQDSGLFASCLDPRDHLARNGVAVLDQEEGVR